MTSDDDLAYKRSVRNMSVILAAIVITVLAALFVPPYLYPPHDVFQSSVSYDSPFFGFAIHLRINATSVPQSGNVVLTGWVNSTSPSVENVTAANAWSLPQGSLREKSCTTGWPIGVGVMKGHYTRDNYTLGTVIPVPQPLASCPVQLSAPRYFLFEALSSKALVTIGGNPVFWRIQTDFTFRGFSGPGVYTAVIADEWGDVLTTNFLVT